VIAFLHVCIQEQQKHTCSCSVCGRRRTVIEEELEMLYDAYYEELQLYEADKGAADSSAATAGMFNFAKSLSVKGADELLKNEGKKFLEMMERLAERRIRKEEAMRRYNEKYDGEDDEEEEYEEEEEEDEEEEDEDADEGDEGEYDEEEDDEDGEEGQEDDITDEQQLEEGRHMFQVFAAKMFEQRVLTAYREKVALEKQRQLIEEERAAKKAALELLEAKAEKK